MSGQLLGLLFGPFETFGFMRIALVACLMTRRRNMERARLELAARSSTSWLDPKLVAVGVQIGQAIGWRRLASLAALAVLAGAAAKEWSARAKPAEDDEAEGDESGSED